MFNCTILSTTNGNLWIRLVVHAHVELECNLVLLAEALSSSAICSPYSPHPWYHRLLSSNMKLTNDNTPFVSWMAACIRTVSSEMDCVRTPVHPGSLRQSCLRHPNEYIGPQRPNVRFKQWAANGGSLRMGALFLIVDSDTIVLEDCFRDAAREPEESPEVAIIQHASGGWS